MVSLSREAMAKSAGSAAGGTRKRQREPSATQVLTCAERIVRARRLVQISPS